MASLADIVSAALPALLAAARPEVPIRHNEEVHIADRFSPLAPQVDQVHHLRVALHLTQARARVRARASARLLLIIGMSLAVIPAAFSWCTLNS